MTRTILMSIDIDFFTQGEHKNYSVKVLEEIVQDTLNKYFPEYNGRVKELMCQNSRELSQYLDEHGADNLISFER